MELDTRCRKLIREIKTAAQSAAFELRKPIPGQADTAWMAIGVSKRILNELLAFLMEVERGDDKP